MVCHWLGWPSCEAYWHIGESTIRLFSVNPRRVMGENSLLAVIPSAFAWAWIVHRVWHETIGFACAFCSIGRTDVIDNLRASSRQTNVAARARKGSTHAQPSRRGLLRAGARQPHHRA